ncbi:response regulator transcription factor [Leucobacter sp. CSA2]|uniref:Response regulator transcription factor n=1 Tax=Leucobacter edaphi TaxID=2796472 RepID=A0A934QFA5_9MICO|nr:response regulator transcription factor [Leucobacter edaphi]MBK0422754.1 response regulator transcription factor [Leucobacter edaphi]
MIPIRVLIAEDEAPTRAALRLLLDHEPGIKVVAEAEDGAVAVRLAHDHRPDVVLMDVQMPGLDGLQAAERLREVPGDPRVIMLTTFDLDEYVFAALRNGAAGFLLKNSPPAEIVRAIRIAHRGDALLAPEVTGRLIGRFATAGAGSSWPVDRLTGRERETLRLVGQGLSNAEISEALFVTQTTVRTYVSRVLAKLSARDRAQLVVAAYESGLAGPGAAS